MFVGGIKLHGFAMIILGNLHAGGNLHLGHFNLFYTGN